MLPSTNRTVAGVRSRRVNMLAPDVRLTICPDTPVVGAGHLPWGQSARLGELFRINAPLSGGLCVSISLQETRCQLALRLQLLRGGRRRDVLLLAAGAQT